LLKQVIADAHRAGRRELVVQAVGFLVDHVEVLYDLDHEAAALAAGLGLGFHRAPCVGDHPDFIGTLADLVEEALERDTAGQ
jgi:ferrochelatase